MAWSGGVRCELTHARAGKKKNQKRTNNEKTGRSVAVGGAAGWVTVTSRSGEEKKKNAMTRGCTVFISLMRCTGKQMMRLERGTSKGVGTLLFAGSQYMCVGGEDGIIRCWETVPGKTAKLLAGLEGHRGAVTSLAFSRVYGTLVSSSGAGDILTHNLQVGGTFQSVASLEAGVNNVVFRPKDPAHIVSVDEDGSFCLWDINRATKQQGDTTTPLLRFAEPHNGPATDVAVCEFHPNMCCSVGLDGNLVVYDLRAKSVAATVDTLHSGMSVAFDRKGFLVGQDSGLIQSFDVRNPSGGPLASLQLDVDEDVLALLLSSDGTSSSGSGGGGQQRSFSVLPMPLAQLTKFELSVAESSVMEGETIEEEVVAAAPKTPKKSARGAIDPSLVFSPVASSFSPVVGVAAAAAAPSVVPEIPSNSSSSPPSSISSSPSIPTPTVVLTPLSTTGLTSTPKTKDAVEPLPAAAAADASPGTLGTPTTTTTTTTATTETSLPPFIDASPSNNVALESALLAVRLQSHREMRDMHVEMLRLFHQQQKATEELTARLTALIDENAALRAENLNLKRTFL